MDTLDELKMLVEYVLCRHGTLHKILSDRVAKFFSELVLECVNSLMFKS